MYEVTTATPRPRHIRRLVKKSNIVLMKLIDLWYLKKKQCFHVLRVYDLFEKSKFINYMF